jgi:hypothetical protein
MPLFTIVSAGAPCRQPLMAAAVRIAALVLLGAALAVTVVTAPAHAIPPVGCGKVKVHGRHYAVKAHVMSCRTARHWTVAWLKHRSHPRGWSCRSFPPRLTRVRFVCENPRTATRSDGPQSYSAAR